MMVINKNLLTEPIILGDHLALDFLNTLFKKDDDIVDCLRTDNDVIEWMTSVGLTTQNSITQAFTEGQLLSAAKILREIIRTLIMQRKKDQQGNPSALNQYLKKAANYTELDWESTSPPQAKCIYISESPQCFLAPIAEAAADLLINGNFSLVKSCEHPKCILWFYDRTKSHKRRWCSMSLCGNRHKVAKFRKAKVQPS